MAGKKVYIAGPMTGRKGFNYEAFHKKAKELRRQGLEVVSPAEDVPAGCKEWEDFMKVGIAKMLACDAVYMMVGWEQSRGARMEHGIAKDLGMLVGYESQGD